MCTEFLSTPPFMLTFREKEIHREVEDSNPGPSEIQILVGSQSLLGISFSLQTFVLVASLLKLIHHLSPVTQLGQTLNMRMSLDQKQCYAILVLVHMPMRCGCTRLAQRATATSPIWSAYVSISSCITVVKSSPGMRWDNTPSQRQLPPYIRTSQYTTSLTHSVYNSAVLHKVHGYSIDIHCVLNKKIRS